MSLILYSSALPRESRLFSGQRPLPARVGTVHGSVYGGADDHIEARPDVKISGPPGATSALAALNRAIAAGTLRASEGPAEKASTYKLEQALAVAAEKKAAAMALAGARRASILAKVRGL